MSERRHTSELHANNLVNSLEGFSNLIFFFKFTEKILSIIFIFSGMLI